MDNIEKLELLSEGKAKKIWKTRNKAHVIMEFKDFSLSYHGKHKIVFEGKGALSNKINNLILKYLEDNGISTHFQQELSDTETLVKNASMIPIEVVVRNYVAGSLVARTGLLEGEALKAPVLEFSYKCEELNDPMINEYHAFAMGLCTSGELDEMCFTALRMNKILKSLFYKAGLLLVDFKTEFGKVNGRLVVADELTPNASRIWDIETREKLDGELSFEHSDKLAAAYTEVLRRLQEAISR